MDEIKTWRQKNGKVVLIRHMSDRHLENAIRMCERGRDKEGARVSEFTKTVALPVLRAEQRRRRTEPQLPGELEARMQAEMEELVWLAERPSRSSIESEQTQSQMSSYDEYTRSIPPT